MRIEVRFRTAVVLLAAVLLTISVGSAVGAELLGEPSTPEYEADLVTLEDDTVLWPYTSRATTFDERTLSLNLIIYGDTSFTQYVLRDMPDAEWEEVDEDRQDIAPFEDPVDELNASTLDWGGAAGADRWIWIDPPEGEPVWLAENYQLEDGDYLGHRHHIRAYEDPHNQEWTALQAHPEHWDWFHLRHTVHSIEESQLTVEEAFIDNVYVESLTRVRWGNDRSSDADGWATSVHLAEEYLPLIFAVLPFGVAGIATGRAREIHGHVRDNEDLLVAVSALSVIASIVIAYHAVRFGAISVERLFPGANPKIIVAIFYPILITGMPILAYLCARRLEATLAFSTATLGFVMAVFIDYTYLEVTRIPLETFIHRGTLAVAIGMIAAGASETARRPGEYPGFVRTGVLLWAVAVAIPLLQFI